MVYKVAFLTKRRDDAVNIVDTNLIPCLKKNIDIQVDVIKFPYYDNFLFKIILLPLVFFPLLNIYRKYHLVHYSNNDNFFIIFHPLFKKLFSPLSCLTVHLCLSKKIFGKIFHSFDLYFCVSPFTQKQVIQTGIDKSKTIIALNGASKIFHYQANKKLKSLKYLLYVGGEYPHKNLETLLKAFQVTNQQYPNLKLIKIGKAWKKTYQKRTDKLIKKLQLSNVELIRKNISQIKLRPYYSQAELLILPSAIEGFGLPVLEAMRCHCIPLVSKIDTYLNFDLPKCCLVKDYLNPQSWANQIEKLINLNSIEKTKIKNYVYQLSLKFSWQKTASIIHRSYLKLIKNSKINPR